MSDLFPELSPQQREKLRLTLHWTGGNYDAAGTLSHYNFVIDGEANMHPGVPLLRNIAPLSPGYAQHTGRANSNNIGLAVCAMWGSEQGNPSTFTGAFGGEYGPYPIREAQIVALCELAADLCRRYDIDVTPQRVRCHCEWSTVEPVTLQHGKWDIGCIPHLDMRQRILGDGTWMSGNYLRAQIRQILAGDMDEHAPVAETPHPVDVAWASFLTVFDTADANKDLFNDNFRAKIKDLRRTAPFRNLKRPE